MKIRMNDEQSFHDKTNRLKLVFFGASEMLSFTAEKFISSREGIEKSNKNHEKGKCRTPWKGWILEKNRRCL